MAQRRKKLTSNDPAEAARMEAEKKRIAKIAEEVGIDPIIYGDDTEDLVNYLKAERAQWLIDQEKIRRGEKRVESRFADPSQGKGIDPKFQVKKLGAEGNIGEVSVVTREVEVKDRYARQHFEDDLWYDQSVRDQLQEYHFDGFHSRPAVEQTSDQVFGNQAKIAAAKEAAVQARKKLFVVPPENFFDAVKADPTADEKLTQIAIREAAERYGKVPKVKRNPFENPHEYSKFTKTGTFLKEFEKDLLAKDVDAALAKWQSGGGAEGSLNIEGYDGPLIEKLGGDAAIEKMTDSFVNYAKKVRGSSWTRGPLIDFNADLIEACTRLNLIKVITIFHKGDGDPNILLSDGEPLFVSLVIRVITLDALTHSLHAAEVANEAPDRKKLQKILNEFVKYEVNINMLRPNGQNALHIAASAGNSKVVGWLLDNGINISTRTEREDMSAMMIASKYGHVPVMSELIKRGGKDLLKIHDRRGLNPLHYCAMTGQTRACIFLLDCGADKRIQDFERKTAGRLAQDAGFLATSQAIACHAHAAFRGQVYLDYIQKTMEPEMEEDKGILGSIYDALKKGAEMMWNAITGGGGGGSDSSTSIGPKRSLLATIKSILTRSATKNKVSPEPKLSMPQQQVSHLGSESDDDEEDGDPLQHQHLQYPAVAVATPIDAVRPFDS